MKYFIGEIFKQIHNTNNPTMTQIRCLGDKMLREVARGTTVVSMWNKLDSLYMTKSLAN